MFQTKAKDSLQYASRYSHFSRYDGIRRNAHLYSNFKRFKSHREDSWCVVTHPTR